MKSRILAWALGLLFVASLAAGVPNPRFPLVPWTCLFLFSLAALAKSWKNDGRSTQTIFFLALTLYLSTFRWHGGDDIPNSILPFSILGHGTLSLDPFRAWFAERGLTQDFTIPAPPHLLSAFPVAPALMVLPLYLIPVLAGLGPQEQLIHNLSKIGASLICALSVLIFYRLARQRAGKSWALGVTLLYAFGTYTFSVSSQALYQHGPSQLALIAALWFLLKERPRPQDFAWSGLALGVAMACRHDNIFFVLPLGLYVLIHRKPKETLRLIFGAAPPLILLLFFYWFYTGKFAPPESAYQSSLFGSFHADAAAAMILSPTRGLLTLMPASLFGLWGLALALRDSKSRWAPYLALGCASTWIFYCYRITWSGGGTFGNRYFAVVCMIITLFCLDLQKRVKKSQTLKLLWAFAFAVSIIVHAGGGYFNWPGSFRVEDQIASMWDWRLYPPFHLFSPEGALGRTPAFAKGLIAAALLALTGGLARLGYTLVDHES